MTISNERSPRFTARRSLLKAGGSALALATTGAAPRALAQAPKRVKLTLPWVAEGTNLFLFVAKNKGFWKKRGIEVEIARGTGSAAAAEAVGAGRFEFGYCATPSAILQTAKGLPLVSLACINYDAGMGITVLADSGIRAPKDLEGRTLGSTVASQEYPFIPLFAKNAGIDLSKVKRVSLDAQLRQKIFLQKQVDAISGSVNSTVPTMTAQGVKTLSMYFNQYGIHLYGGSIVCQPKTLQSDPALCEAVVQGAIEGLVFALTDPEAAVQAFATEVKEVSISAASLEQVRVSLGMFALNALHPDPEKNGMGWMNPAVMASMTDLAIEYLAAPGTPKPPVESLYTNRFTGKVKMPPEQWAAAKKHFQRYKPDTI